MKIMVVLGHPQPGSFNHAIAETVVDTARELGHTVMFHDLYQEGFNPLMTAEEQHAPVFADALAERHARELTEADGLVIVHPNWFSQAPAILKGWVDRVVRARVAFRFNEQGQVEGLLRAKVGMVITTANAPLSREAEIGNPLPTLWRETVIKPSGIREFVYLPLTPIVVSTLTQRQAWLAQVRDLVKQHFPADRQEA
jgi:putative NADPH-quinone reductase